MDCIIYIYSFFLSAIILYLFKVDIKKFKNRLYYEISNEIWIKLYCIISIFFIHLIWFFSVFFFNYEDTSLLYGIPYFLIVPYILYITADFKKSETIASEKINKYLNYLTSIYLVFIIIIIAIPNCTKRKIIKYIKDLIVKILT